MVQRWGDAEDPGPYRTVNGHGTLVLPSRRVLTCGHLHLSHPRLSLRTSLGDRAVSPGTPGPIGTHVARDRRVSPDPVSRSAATCDKVGEQARSVNLFGIRSRGGVKGITRWLTVKIHRGKPCSRWTRQSVRP